MLIVPLPDEQFSNALKSVAALFLIGFIVAWVTRLQFVMLFAKQKNYKIKLACRSKNAT